MKQIIQRFLEGESPTLNANSHFKNQRGRQVLRTTYFELSNNHLVTFQSTLRVRGIGMGSSFCHTFRKRLLFKTELPLEEL